MGATNPNAGAGATPGGGGKGGMGMNRGPLGNAQNNPNNVMPGQQTSPGMGPSAWQGNMMQGLGSGGPGQVSPLGPAGPAAGTWGSRNPMGTPNWAATGSLTPMHNLTAGQPQKFSMPQPSYQPSTGWVDGQPAQWAAQKAAMNPAPSPQQGILDIRNRMLYGR